MPFESVQVRGRPRPRLSAWPVWRTGLLLAVLVFPAAVRAAGPAAAPVAPSAGDLPSPSPEAGPSRAPPPATADEEEDEEGLLLDATVAMLGEQLLTRSDLIFEARIRALAQQGPVGLSAPMDVPRLAETLETSLLGRLLAQEAERLGVPPLTEAEKQTQLAQLEAQAGGPALLDAFLTRHGADRAQLLGLLERWEQASRALEVRVRVRAQVTEAEIRAAHAQSGSSRPYAEERERIARELRQERSRAVTARERQRLMENAAIRRLAPWARAESSPEGDGP